MCPTGEMCPHAVQMALATDRTGARKGSEGPIGSRDVIAAQNAASEALKGLWQRWGGGGRSSPHAKEEVTPWDTKHAQPVSWSFDVTLS